MSALCPRCLFNDIAIRPEEMIAFCRQRVEGFPNRSHCEHHINIEEGFESEESAQSRIQRRLNIIRES